MKKPISLLSAAMLVLISALPSVLRSADRQNARGGLVEHAPEAAFVDAMLRSPETGEVETRIALVVGNGDYTSFPRLANPVRDANEVARRLQALGFHVLVGIDLDAARLRAALETFSSRLGSVNAALFYYAGHGVQVNDSNYVIATDAGIRDGDAVGFVPLDDVLANMLSAKDAAMAMLDACRDNGLARMGAHSINGQPVRSVGRGLNVEALPRRNAQTSSGIFIAFATSPNMTASDGDGQHSPFTQALLDNLGTSGFAISGLMSKVSEDVKRLTRGTQTPWTRSSLTQEFYFNGRDTRDAAAERSRLAAKRSEERMRAGRRDEAIAAALEGIPANFEPDMVELFAPAYAALYAAVQSRTHLVPVEAQVVEARVTGDGTMLAVSSAIIGLMRTIVLQDANTGQKLRDLQVGNGVLDSPAAWDMSGDGRIATLTMSGAVAIRDGRSGRQMRTWKAYAKDGTGIRFSPDASMVVTTGEEAPMRVWQVDSGTQLAEKSYSRPQRASGGQRERLDLSGMPDNGDPEAMRRFLEGVVAQAGAGAMQSTDLTVPRFSPDGRYVGAAVNAGSAGSGGGMIDPTKIAQNVVVWGLQGDQMVAELKGHTGPILDFVFNASARRVVSCSMDGTARLWELPSGRQLFEFSFGGAPEGVSMSPDGRTVLTVAQTTQGPRVRYWSTESGSEILSPRPADSMAFDWIFVQGIEACVGLATPTSWSWRKGPAGALLVTEALKTLPADLASATARSRIRFWTRE